MLVTLPSEARGILETAAAANEASVATLSIAQTLHYCLPPVMAAWSNPSAGLPDQPDLQVRSIITGFVSLVLVLLQHLASRIVVQTYGIRGAA